MGMGVYHKQVSDDSLETVFHEIAISGPRGTNNIAEYLAVLCALTDMYILEGARRSKGPYIDEDGWAIIHSDSQLVIKQLTGEYGVKNPDMKILYDAVKKVEDRLTQLRMEVTYIWNSRDDENQDVADKLSKIGNRYFNEKQDQEDEPISYGITELQDILLPGSYELIHRGLNWGSKRSV